MGKKIGTHDEKLSNRERTAYRKTIRQQSTEIAMCRPNAVKSSAVAGLAELPQ